MSLQRVFLICAALGVSIPLALLSIGRLLGNLGAISPKNDYYFFMLRMLVWPSSYPFSAITHDVAPFSFQYLFLLAAALFVNVLIYCLIGALIWLGTDRFRPGIYIAAGTVLAYWIWLFRA